MFRGPRLSVNFMAPAQAGSSSCSQNCQLQISTLACRVGETIYKTRFPCKRRPQGADVKLLVQEIGGCGFPFEVEALEGGVDDAIHALDVHTAHHAPVRRRISRSGAQSPNNGQPRAFDRLNRQALGIVHLNRRW